MEKKSRSPKNGLPQHYQHFGKKYPAVVRAYEALGEATPASRFARSEDPRVG